jgi:hypothetical protein
MAEFNDFVSDLTSRLARGLGLKTSDKEQLKQWRTKYEKERAATTDSWEQIKDDVRRIEARLKKHKAEYEAAHGMVKEMVGRQIEQAFRELDRKQAQIAIVQRNMETLGTFLDRISELEHAKAAAVSDLDLDALAVQLEEGFDAAQKADHALKDLDKVQYAAAEQPSMDVERRLGEMERTKTATPGLSRESVKRLKRLEKDTES